MTETMLRLRPDGLDWRVIDEEVVLLDAEQSIYFATNPSGTLLWRSLNDGATRMQLVEALAARFAIERAQAEADVDLFLADLHDRGLLAES